MAAIETVLSDSATNTLVDNDALNPTVVNTNGRKVVHVTLVFQGVDFDPNDIFDALNAEWPTVSTNKSLPSRGCYIFHITA